MALAILAGTAALAWATMDADRIRAVVLVVIGAFALRILLTRRGAVGDEQGEDEDARKG